ncbi:hypothetical protein ACE6H2_017010 [Prunus campanulata]
MGHDVQDHNLTMLARQDKLEEELSKLPKSVTELIDLLKSMTEELFLLGASNPYPRMQESSAAPIYTYSYWRVS